MSPEGPPRLAWGMWKRFSLAAVLIVALSAATTATAGLLEVKSLDQALHPNAKPALKIPELAPNERGPQTILLMGSDVRKIDRERGLKGNSDTMILVRLDPTKKATAMLSIPRDLKARIPGFGTAKINAAYPQGGTRLTVRTIQANLPGIKINHVVDTNFKGFKAMVNRIGCMYVDIDRRYFNDNAVAYATIDVKPGYQKMCGDRALDYVRFRHEDTDLVRGARQQDFIRQARTQVGVQKLLGDRNQLLRLFGRYTKTDIKGTNQLLRLFKVVAFSIGHPIQEVRFRADVGPSYVTASDAQKRRTIREFLNAHPSAGPRGRNPSAPTLPTQSRRRPSPGSLDLEEARTAGEDQAIAAAPGVPFPVLFPRLRKAGSVYVDVPRTYVIDGPGGRRYPAYRIVARTGELGAYYGIQGTTWKDPPLLQNPSETQKLAGGRTLLLYGDGNRLRLVALRTPQAAYWVSNTLLLSLTNRQMVTIARSFQRIGAR
ncbi:MAG: polyisoprenyl-teichoic acid--peptidoglycan teichoic acid transferase [Solirubrobacteraceae bacterium]|jgi:LCP family protein required for cell wall assembly|nr:polyisoprenyl-teichoic acid--peptidoglycan teichoic acid transferase [Solirubrobacteraceae bacterium]